MRTLLTSVLVLLLGSVITSAQDTSYETFNAIRLENSSNPGAFVTLTAPTATTSYTLIMPATGPTSAGGWSFSATSGGTAMSWFETPTGAANQIGFFTGTNAVVSNSSLTWTDASKQLGITSVLPGALMALSKNGVTPSASSMVTLSNTQTSSVSTTKTLMSLDASGSMASGSTVTGLSVNVAGGTNNYAALFNGGRVGIGTSTPNTRLDVNGSYAVREFNYTGSLSATNNDFSFVSGNDQSFVRVGTATTAETVFNGFAGGVDGKFLTIYNATGNMVRLAHENTSSTSTNRISAPGGIDVLVPHTTAYQLVYSATDQRWIIPYVGGGNGNWQGYKNVTATLTSGTNQMPTANASYVRVTTGNTQPSYDVSYQDGTAIGQFLVIENFGPKDISFVGTNFKVDAADQKLGTGNSILFIWNGVKWIQVAEAQN